MLFNIHTAMDYIALSDSAARQVIDSSTIFDEFTRVELQMRPYAGGIRIGKFNRMRSSIARIWGTQKPLISAV
jgi:hypothetical protein